MTRTPATGTGPEGRSAWLAAVLFTLPVVLLALAWLVATPAAGAPDEPSHLIKALAVARGDLGTPGGPAPAGSLPVIVRNASISRVVTIPGRLAPDGYACFAFRDDVTAACQRSQAPRQTGDVVTTTTLGAYPPFLYPPIGWAASLGQTPQEAFLLGRAVVLAVTGLLLLLASWHLVRWLGRRALVGVMVLATPLAVFCMAVLSTSGIEIFAALGVAVVVTVWSRRPESLQARSTLVVLGGCGTLLVLSRQLGIVTMGALVLLFLALGGWRDVLDAVRRRSRLLLTVLAVVGLATVATTVWELGFDHPALTGTVLDAGAWSRWWGRAWLMVGQSGVGWFGWLDTRMAPGVTDAWLVLLAAVVLLALLVGSWRDRLVLAATTLGLVAMAGAVYVTVFDPVHAGLQGRHVLPFLAVLPVYAGVVLGERLPPRLTGALLVALAVALPLTQLYGFLLAGERNAVGLPHVSWSFVDRATWAPPGGWPVWIGLATVACGLMAAGWVTLAFSQRPRRRSL